MVVACGVSSRAVRGAVASQGPAAG